MFFGAGGRLSGWVPVTRKARRWCFTEQEPFSLAGGCETGDGRVRVLGGHALFQPKGPEMV